MLPAGVTEQFLAARGRNVEYEPRIGARVRTHFVDARAGLDAWVEAYHLAPLDERGPLWDEAEVCDVGALALEDEPAAGASFADVPGQALTAKAQQQFAKLLADHVYRTGTMTVYRCPALKATAAPGTSEGEFRAQLALGLREKRDAAVDSLRRKYAARLDTLAGRQRRAEQKLQKEKDQASSETMSSALAVGGSLLGALFGGSRRSSAFGKAASAARSVGRIGRERSDVANAAADLAALHDRHADLEHELEAEIAALESGSDPARIVVESVVIRTRKSDIDVADLALVWQPA